MTEDAMAVALPLLCFVMKYQFQPGTPLPPLPVSTKYIGTVRSQFRQMF